MTGTNDGAIVAEVAGQIIKLMGDMGIEWSSGPQMAYATYFKCPFTGADHPSQEPRRFDYQVMNGKTQHELLTVIRANAELGRVRYGRVFMLMRRPPRVTCGQWFDIYSARLMFVPHPIGKYLAGKEELDRRVVEELAAHETEFGSIDRTINPTGVHFHEATAEVSQ